jgi:lipoprotein-anchoring transpeptidase ErfK/SrfK
MTEVPKSEHYGVEEGDTLDAIAKRFGTTADLLKESNRVDPRRLQIGKRLKVVTGKFGLKISKSRYILQLLSGDVVLNEYSVGTGKFGKTPVGEFRIADKVKEPPWFRNGRVIRYGDPENVLGTRWMKLESTDGQTELTGYGIHGTDDESSIGKKRSEGCIRLLNRDVEELYKIVPVGTEVTIED